ncbi:hypothetical protein [Streptomyces sp. NPDC057199]|uniref:hypothetical protein n=1 Tax=Streptomyces sp. NPDC057199 TaxID=3346047 RepID=UPI00363D1DB3
MLLAGCGSASVDGASADPGPAGTATTAPAGDEPLATPTISAPPSPTASDGTRYAACADGTCEIRVAEGAEVPVPARLGLGPVAVIMISDGAVTVFAPLTRSEFSSDGGCQAAFTGPAENSSAYAEMTCDEGAGGVVNQMKLRVVVGDGAAILRIRPAT